MGIALFALGVACSISGCKRQDVPVRTTKSITGKSASIVAYKDSIIFGSYSADLVLHSVDGRVVLRTNLIQGRDGIEDIPIEFFSLEFTNDVVHIGTQGIHYHGTNEIKFPNP